MSQPTIDHRGPEFARMTLGILERLKLVVNTSGPVLLYPSSGTGAWEAALVNTLSPGDRVLAFETGHFAAQWRNVATRIGVDVDWVEGDWRHGADPVVVESRLGEDSDHAIKAVLVVHNETSTGITSRVAEVRKAIDSARHPAL
jgi:alanine-glyoxylate transaminase/serine-glyoxylate transaminase/serine-pyruvate transaminase